MAKETNSYNRKLSADEFENGFLFITREGLSFLPPVGKFFKINVGDRKFDSRIEAYDCLCRGPNKPHQHFKISIEHFIPVLSMEKGKNITLSAGENKEYTLICE